MINVTTDSHSMVMTLHDVRPELFGFIFDLARTCNPQWINHQVGIQGTNMQQISICIPNSDNYYQFLRCLELSGLAHVEGFQNVERAIAASK